MDNQNNIFGWVVGGIIVLLIIAGLWWFVQANPATNGTATTTPQVATTTGQGSLPAPTSVEVRTSATVSGVIASLSDSSRFASLYTSTGVAASVAGAGPYTVFVPADGAFANLPDDIISDMTAAARKRMVQYHIVAGKMLDLDAVSSGTYTALSKDVLNFQVHPQTKLAYVNSGYTTKQYKASNGIVYVISAVLIPPQTPDSQTGSTGTIVPGN